MWSELQLQRSVPIRQQVESYVRSLILSGELKAGEKLPTTEELACSFGANVRAVHAALTPMVREGLLTRHPGVGTFVRYREERLTRVAIYWREDEEATENSSFYGVLLNQLKGLLHDQGIEPDVWIDPRPEAAQDAIWPALAAAARDRRVQAVIVTRTNSRQVPGLLELPVPVAILGSANLPNGVNADLRQVVQLGVEALARQGCRSVGMITPIHSSASEYLGQLHSYFEFFDELVSVARLHGMEIRSDWMRHIPHENDWIPRSEYAAFGYREFGRLWDLPERPQGLLVYPDEVAHGVIHGLLERQVQVPQELKLVFHKNARIPILCPMEATWLVWDEREVAQALIKQIQRQFQGEECVPIQIDHTLSANFGCGTATAKDDSKKRGQV